MTSKALNCYCDHCANNTCTTNQLCYAEWKLVNHNQHATTASLLPAQPQTLQSQPLLKLEKSFNCFRKDDPLIIRTICNETATNTSHVIRRCCQSGDYCNRVADLLPTEEEATEEIRRHLPAALLGSDSDNLFADLANQYSRLPLGLQIFIIAVSAILLGYTVLLLTARRTQSEQQQQQQQNQGQRQRQNQGPQQGQQQQRNHHRGPFKRLLNRFLLNLSRRANPASDVDLAAASSRGPSRRSPNISQSRLGGTLEDGSEHSSKANFDTNSMASREPLIGRHSAVSPLSPSSTINIQHSGPYMDETTVNGKTQSSIQITLGSAACATMRQDTSSGSGAGQPYLTQRSIAHDIELVEVVGRGFFGIVWRGEYKGEPVAVKIFSPVAESSWEREAEIYQTTMLRHKNILGFIATDKRHDASLMGYWLVTDYYPMGSLYDFLKENTMAMADAVRMAFSIANGLSHLHIEIFGTRGKPAIAHRDLKSKNILVKNDGTCCIADLGMAVRHSSHTGIVDVPTNSRIGTRRYLAPEILESKLNLMDFEAVKSTDIYAMGLVLWEILRRTCLLQETGTDPMDPNFSFNQEQQVTEPTSSRSSSPSGKGDEGPAGTTDQPSKQKEQETPSKPALSLTRLTIRNSETNQPPSGPEAEPDRLSGRLFTPFSPQSTFANDTFETTLDEMNKLAFLCEGYEAPYQTYVSMDPSADEMREVVCVRKIRPDLAPRWEKFASMRDYVTLMTECWYEKPQARLSALRVRKSLSNIAKKYFNLNMEYD